ncbi:MAG: heme-dependent oxidative N-demethylase subunit alpha family protein [Burkholderiaceae bacterium]
MDFDLLQIAVPFRMQPGLARVDAAACRLTPLHAGSALYADKHAVWQAGQSRHTVPGLDAGALRAAMAAIDAHAPQPASAASALGAEAALPLELRFEEDFALVDGERGTIPWMCLCVPSHWAPEDKLGLSLAAIHAPVADAATLLAASEALTRLVTSGEHWQRHVWTVSPSPRHDQHPRRHARTPWPVVDTGHPDALDRFARQCWLRAERQSFLPVPGGSNTRQSVFAIRVMLQPLVDAVSDTARAQRLHDAIASMNGAVLAYKGLTEARDPLLRWLEQRAQSPQGRA